MKSYNLTQSEIELILDALDSYHGHRYWEPWTQIREKAEMIRAELNK